LTFEIFFCVYLNFFGKTKTLRSKVKSQKSGFRRFGLILPKGKNEMSDDYKADVYYAGDDFFIGKTPSGHSQVLDTHHDRSSAASPVELLLIALGACTAVDVVSILKKKRQDVTGYRVEVRGERREEHPRAFTKMEVKHIVHGHNVSPEAVARAIELSETKYCSVAATLRPTVEIISIYEIIEEKNLEST
jgi:putative redox protein